MTSEESEHQVPGSADEQEAAREPRLVPEVQRRSCHQAGHALVAYLLGWDYGCVTIDPSASSDDPMGTIDYHRRPIESLHDMQQFLSILFAGPMGEQLCTRIRNPFSAAAADREVRRILERIPDESIRFHIVTRATESAAYMLHTEWWRTAKLADMRIAQQSVTWSEVGAVTRLDP